MILTIIFLAILLGISIYVNVNLLKRNERLEEAQDLIANDYEELYNKMLLFEAVIDDANKKLKEIDFKGSFESDDEVGFFFKELKNIQDDINKFLQ
jgi:hypothetical protein